VGSLFDLENLQVLKGPQGTLFGRNTTGGAILLVPTKPKDTLGGFLEGSLGNYDMHRVQGVVNVPLSDTFRIRAGADWNQRDGYVHNKTNIGPNDFDNVNYIATRLSIVGDLTPDLENYTIFSYSKSDTHGDQVRLSICDTRNPATLGPADPPISPLAGLACYQIARAQARGDGFWDVENNNPNPREFLKQWQVINTTTWKASDTLTIKNIVSYTEFFESANFSLWGDNYILPPGIPGAGLLATKTINLLPGFYKWTTAQANLTEELQFQGRTSDGRLNWQAGAYLAHSDPLGWNSQLVENFISCTDIRTATCVPTNTGSISDANTKDTFRNYGLYAQATYKFTDQLSVTGGVRYSWDKQTDLSQSLNINVFTPAQVGKGVFSCQDHINFHGPGGFADPLVVTDPARCNISRTLKSKRPTWLIDVDYKPTGDMLLYAKYARGYREGSITPNSIGFETVGPEKVDAFEIGAKTSWRGAISGYFNVAAFYNKFANQQLAVNSLVAPQYIGVITAAAPNVNAGKSRMYGVEVDAAIIPFEGLKLDVGYTYLNTKLQSFVAPPLPPYYTGLFPATEVGGPLPLSPKNRVTVSANYTLPLDESVGQISFGGTFVHTDKNQSRSCLADPLCVVPAQNELNLNASWDSILGAPVDLTLFMTNVTNQKRILFPTGSFYYIGGEGAHVNQPRMWGASLKYHFGE
jgi:iron complex outermembrane receptor protein